MLRAALTLAVAFALGGLVYARGCAGPRPEVVAAGLAETPRGLVPSASVRNDGRDGEVEVRFRIVELDSGRRIGAEGRLQVRRGETVEVRAPEALAPGRYVVDAEATYPPD